MSFFRKKWYNTIGNIRKGAKTMFQLGQTVLYGTEGVCVIDHIEEMKVNRVKMKYYVLKPIYNGGATIFVPMDNVDLLGKMRRILSREEIHAILDNLQDDELAWVEDHNERRQVFQSILSAGDRAQIVRLIRVLYLRRQQLRECGKHLRSADEQILREAEKLLNDEFALVLNISRQEVPDYIRLHIEQGA